MELSGAGARAYLSVNYRTVDASIFIALLVILVGVNDVVSTRKSISLVGLEEPANFDVRRVWGAE